jgi:hypothetical protein
MNAFLKFFGSVLLFATLAFPVQAQYIDARMPAPGQERDGQHRHFFQHDGIGAPHLCSVDSILQDSVSVQALRNYHELRRLQPEGALVFSLMDDAVPGDERDFRVRNIETNDWSTISFTLRALSDRLRIWVEEGEFAPDQVNQEVIDGLMTALDEQTPPLSRDPGQGILDNNGLIFGDAPDIDGSGLLNILITDVQDGWEPDTNSGFVAGFFDPVDLDPSNSNSNKADIIYLNSRPLIYFDGEVNPFQVRSVAAHEYQHLIHANYGALNTFQNEGQSEWAELLNGYQGRAPLYLSLPDELRGLLYGWRRGEDEVSRDYQRASLLHSFIADRAGEELTGSITRAAEGGDPAYETVLSQAGIQLEELLLDFHITNYVNDRDIEDGRYGYEDIRRQSYSVTFPTWQFFTGQTSASQQGQLSFGGAEYAEWIGAKDFTISLSGSEGIEFALISIPVDGPTEVQPVSAGSHFLSGEYERIVLVSAATTSVQSLPTAGLKNEPDFSYNFSSEWESLPIITQELSYAANPAAFAELPGLPGDPDREGIQRLAKRFSPDFDSRIDEVSFVVNGRDSSLIGSSDLEIRFHRAVDGSTAPLPGPELGQVRIPITQLTPGNNRINVRNQNWRMVGGTEYYIVFEMEGSSSRIEFLLDPGSEDENNGNYFPVRTQLYIEPPTVSQAGWYFYSDRNNLLAAMRITGEYAGPLQAPEITGQPQSQGSSLGAEVTLSVQASGIPSPIYQWYKDDVPLYGENERQLLIEDMQPENEGRYTVRVSNPGGSVLSEAALLSLDFSDFALSQNFPNPVLDFTTFEFILPEDARISLRLFDVQGREVARIIDSQLFEAGLRQIEYQPAIASGIYFYQFRARGSESGTTFTQARKMIKL